MEPQGQTYSIVKYALPIGIAVVGGFSLWYWGSPYARVVEITQPKLERVSEDAVAVTSRNQEHLGRIGLQYALAIQKGDCEEILALTWWMQERLKRVALSSADPAQAEKTEKELCEEVLRRVPEENQLRPTGIQDQYVFKPGASIRVAYVDSGAANLEKSVRERVWLDVKYSKQADALRDESGRAIRSLLVGINVSEDNYVLKSGVTGNIEIEWDSVSYDWTK